MRKEIDAFKVAAVIYADACFLGPRGVQETNDDMASYVLSALKDSSRKIKQSIQNGNKSVTQ
jgi:hypothetical protein